MSSPPNDDRNNALVTATASDSAKPTTTTGATPDPALIREFFQLQEREIEVRQEEINLQKLERGNAHEYAKLALDAQAADRRSVSPFTLQLSTSEGLAHR